MSRTLVTANQIWIELQAQVDALPVIREAAKTMVPGDRLGLAGKPVTLDIPALLARSGVDGCNWDLTRFQGIIPGGWQTIAPLIEAARAKYNVRTIYDPPPASVPVKRTA